MSIPENLIRLHVHEEALRAEAIALVEADAQLALHFDLAVHAMDLCDVLRQFVTEDEDLKVVQVLAMRTFNAFASSMKLLFSGYSQTSALILRDVLECVFLVDLFRTDPAAITRWRTANKRLDAFKPVNVRQALDARDGLTSQRRGQLYRLFSEMAGHPSMHSIAMLRPRGKDAQCGPFVDKTSLEAVIAETGILAGQVGLIFGEFVPRGWPLGVETKLAFNARWADWERTAWPTKTPVVERR